MIHDPEIVAFVEDLQNALIDPVNQYLDRVSAEIDRLRESIIYRRSGAATELDYYV